MDELSPDDQELLIVQLQEPSIATSYPLVQRFLRLVHERGLAGLDAWIATCGGSQVSASRTSRRACCRMRRPCVPRSLCRGARGQRKGRLRGSSCASANPMGAPALDYCGSVYSTLPEDALFTARKMRKSPFSGLMAVACQPVPQPQLDLLHASQVNDKYRHAKGGPALTLRANKVIRWSYDTGYF